MAGINLIRAAPPLQLEYLRIHIELDGSRRGRRRGSVQRRFCCQAALLILASHS